MNHSPPTPDSPPPSPTRFLDAAARALLVAIAVVALVHLLGYRSDRPDLGPWSWRFLAGAVLPVAGLGLTALIGPLRLLPVALRGRAAAPATWTVPALFAIYLGHRCPEPHGAVVLPVLAGGLLLLVATGVPRDPRFRLVPPALLLPVAILFLAEIHLPIGGTPMVQWADADCFAADPFPEHEPFIGPGGRLRGGLDARMPAPEYPTGARIRTDSLGLRREGETTPRPAPGLRRVLNLGDSFTAGFCADQEHFFGSLLEREMSVSEPTEVLTAEVSDPAYGLIYLQEHGLDLEPDLVLYGLCANDAMQAHWFAGPGRRFRLADGRLEANPDWPGDGTSFYELYRDLAYSRAGPGVAEGGGSGGLLASLVRFRLLASLAAPLATRDRRAVPTRGFADHLQADGRLRLLDGAANLGLYLEPAPPEIEAIHTTLESLLATMAARCRQSGIPFALVIFPQRHQVQPADWAAMRDAWNLSEGDFDLDRPQGVLQEICRRHGILCIDPLEEFREAASDGQLYLPGGDVHFNRRGHALAAAATASRLAGVIGDPAD